MNRKKWTPNEVVTDAVVKIREKRKWQIALRRYILEGSPCYEYAPFFGIDSKSFRNWIEIQFVSGMAWESFGKIWQFDHIVPLQFFDFSSEEDLRLCWNFINIRPSLCETHSEDGLNILSAKSYFASLFNIGGIEMADRMVKKLQSLEEYSHDETDPVRLFLKKKAEHLNLFAEFGPEDYLQLNSGSDLQDIMLQKQILTKFG